MIAGGAYFGRFLADDYMSAVSAFPHFNFALCEYFRRFYVFKQRAVSFFMRFLDSRYETEFYGKVVEAFFFGGFGKSVVHIRPFVIFARCGGAEIFGGVAYSV